MHHFIVSRDNAFRMLHGPLMRCSASVMFSSLGVNRVSQVLVKSIQLTMQITCFSEFDCANIINCDEHLISSLHKSWLCTLQSNIMHNYANVHGIVVFGFLTTSITIIN